MSTGTESAAAGGAAAASAEGPIIRVEDAWKVYRRGDLAIEVLRGLTVSVDAKEFLALTGPSGSGKTTLLNLVAGLDRPTRGRVVVQGQEISAVSESALARWRARHVGFVFQFYNLIPVLTAAENVDLPLQLTKLSRKQRKEHVHAALEVVGLADRAQHYPRQLSGGQEQRVAIARAIVTDPTFIVADEPTGDLDASSADDVLDLLVRLNEEFHKTIVMVTHDPRAAVRAHRRMHLDKGVLSDSE